MIDMTGVEILNTIYEYGSLISPVWFVSFLVATLIIAIFGICTIDYDNVQKILQTLSIVGIIGMAVCGIGLAIETDEIVGIKYDVIISDDVTMNEFNEKYEIIKQNGKIYTVKERD